jgi:hypothetical protein
MRYITARKACEGLALLQERGLDVVPPPVQESKMPAVQNTFKAELIKHHHHCELRVTGDVTEPTTGWTVSLERAVPQGINPKILLLKLIEVKPSGAAGNVVTTHHVKYDENPAQVEYTDATIEGAFSIKVHHVAHA